MKTPSSDMAVTMGYITGCQAAVAIAQKIACITDLVYMPQNYALESNAIAKCYDFVIVYLWTGTHFYWRGLTQTTTKSQHDAAWIDRVTAAYHRDKTLMLKLSSNIISVPNSAQICQVAGNVFHNADFSFVTRYGSLSIMYIWRKSESILHNMPNYKAYIVLI